MEELGNRDGRVAGTAEDNGALETELKVDCWAEREGFGVDVGVIRVGVALEAAVEEVVADGTEEAGDEWNMKRLDAVDAERVDVLGVVGPCQGAAVGWSEPCVVFTARELVSLAGGRRGSLRRCERDSGRRYGPRWDGGLVVVETCGGADLVII